MKTKILMGILIAVFLASCSMARLQTSDFGSYYPPSIAENIEIYSTEKANHSYIVIGDVVASVDAWGDGSASVKYLKKEAAELGADAIINLRLEIGNGVLSNSVTASGTAVKFKN